MTKWLKILLSFFERKRYLPLYDLKAFRYGLYLPYGQTFYHTGGGIVSIWVANRTRVVGIFEDKKTLTVALYRPEINATFSINDGGYLQPSWAMSPIGYVSGRNLDDLPGWAQEIVTASIPQIERYAARARLIANKEPLRVIKGGQ